MMTLSGLRIKLSPCRYVLFKADIVVNSIKTLVSCYFYRNDETNIAMRKCVNLELSLKYFMEHEIFKLDRI